MSNLISTDVRTQNSANEDTKDESVNRFAHSSDGRHNDDGLLTTVKSNLVFSHISNFFFKVDHGKLENQFTSDAEVLPIVKVSRASKLSHLAHVD